MAGMHKSGEGKWVCGRFVFSLSRPLLMGIVNVTPDSFSDGGRYASAAAAVSHGLSLAEAGADIVDVGGESTRPGAPPVDEETEKRRTLPVIEKLAAQGIAVSTDTMKPSVMSAALDAGACILNDVGGFRLKKARAIAAAASCGVVVMHMKGTPRTMQAAPRYKDVVGEVGAFLRRQTRMLTDLGVERARICIDPGAGFGKTAAHNWQLLRELPRLQTAGGGFPLLLGISRKSLFAALNDLPPSAKNNSPKSRQKKSSASRRENQDKAMRDLVSATAVAILSLRGASVLRVHNIPATRSALKVAAMFSEK